MSDKTLTSCDKVTRIEIIDTNGRKFVTGSYKTTVQLQDMGLTLKIFINERPYSEVFASKARRDLFKKAASDGKN